MSKIYFLGSVLPPLRLGMEPEISFEELMLLYKDNLSRSEMKKVEAIRAYIDLKNVQSLLKKEEIDHRGNRSEKELDEAIVNQQGLPEYLFDYLEESDAVEKQIRHFSKVFNIYFQEMENEYAGFLHRYFRFEREWRILLVGYRAKKLGVDGAVELQHEDFHDPFVAQVLAQKDAPFFEFPFEYVQLGETLKDVRGKPKEEYEAMALFRFKYVGEQVQDRPFSLDYLLGYMVQLMIAEDAYALSESQGNQVLSEIVKGSL